jgi:hypothetical protein
MWSASVIAVMASRATSALGTVVTSYLPLNCMVVGVICCRSTVCCGFLTEGVGLNQTRK